MDEILDECHSIVDSVCEKYNYNDKDVEGNASLKTILMKIIPAMLKDANAEDRKLFYSMLEHTPIVITENLTNESFDQLMEQYIPKNNSHIIVESSEDVDEYGKSIGAGAYVSDPIFDENLQLIGKNSFIYIQKISGKAKDFFETDINVSHLIHELGHAWHAESNEYTMQNETTLKARVGTSESIYSFSKQNDGTFIQKRESVTGLMIEEGMNTVAEEKALSNYTGLPLDEIKKIYKQILIPSKYQGSISYLVDHMLNSLHYDDFEQWRLYGNLESKEKINSLMSQTEFWKNREKDILPDSDSPRNYSIKQEIISRSNSSRLQDFFSQYEKTYFPNISEMTPLEKIDNVLFQYYNLNTVMYNMDIDDYGDFLKCLAHEGYALLNQSNNLIKLEELHNTVSTVRLSELDQITKETKSLTKSIDQNLQLEEKGESK